VVELVTVRLDDGAVVELSRRAAEDLYDLLWSIAPREGAVTTAAKLNSALRGALLGAVIDLDAEESRALEHARALL
jgi:hypothetical protein